jgi:hypothetical protein
MTDTLMVTATCIIAGFTVGLFILQWFQHRHDKKVANATYKVTLFEKRMAVYFEIEKNLQEFMREGGPPMEATLALRYNARNAHFVFPKEAIAFVDELVEKGFEHHRAELKWEPLRKRAWEGEDLSDQENEALQNALDKKHEIEDWFMQQVQDKRLEAALGPYLILPSAL